MLRCASPAVEGGLSDLVGRGTRVLSAPALGKKGRIWNVPRNDASLYSTCRRGLGTYRVSTPPPGKSSSPLLAVEITSSTTRKPPPVTALGKATHSKEGMLFAFAARKSPLEMNLPPVEDRGWPRFFATVNHTPYTLWCSCPLAASASLFR